MQGVWITWSETTFLNYAINRWVDAHGAIGKAAVRVRPGGLEPYIHQRSGVLRIIRGYCVVGDDSSPIRLLASNRIHNIGQESSRSVPVSCLR